MAFLCVKRESNKRKNEFSTTTIESLPTELLSEVLARVASTSMVDLYRAKLCCRDFLKVAEDDYIYQNISMDKFPFIPWNTTEKESSFLKRCRKSGNSESLYREGMVEYFSRLKVSSGLERLKEAAEKGHKEAKYVYGIILLCSEDEDLNKEGVELLRCLRISKCVIRCRNKVDSFFGRMWMNNRTMFQNKRRSLCSSRTCKGFEEISKIEGGWPLVDDDDEEKQNISCEYCRLDYEVRHFSKMLDLV